MKKIILGGVFIALFIPSFSFASFDTNLKFGMSGDSVNSLQDLLNSENCLTVAPTGYFGLMTLAGVQCFQTKYSLPSTGYFGSLSRGQANKIVASATESSDQAEVAETGAVATPAPACSNGAFFNNTTGAPCSANSIPQAIITAVSQVRQNLGSVATPTVTPTPAPFENDSLSVADHTDPNNGNAICVNSSGQVMVDGLGSLFFGPSSLPTHIKQIIVTSENPFTQPIGNFQVLGGLERKSAQQITPGQFIFTDVTLPANSGQLSFSGDRGPITATSSRQITVTSIRLVNGNYVSGLPVTFTANYHVANSDGICN